MLAAACGSRSTPVKEPAVSGPLVAEIVKLEGSRSGASRLAELASGGPSEVRGRALLALGREGDPASVPVIAQYLADADPAVRLAAADALGVIGDPAAAPALVQAINTGVESNPAPWLGHAALALGRVGDELDAPPALTKLLELTDPTLRAAGARALGALGQRKISIGPDALDALAAATKDPDARVRYAAVYALMRAALRAPGAVTSGPAFALIGAMSDADAETRAMAVRGASAAGGDPGSALEDADWRVRVEAVRALTADGTPAAAHTVVAAWLGAELDRGARAPSSWAGTEAHPRLEALTRLAEFATEPDVTAVFAAARKQIAAAAAAPDAKLALETADCLATVGLVRDKQATLKDVLACGGASPVHEAYWKRALAWALVRDKQVALDGDARAAFKSFADSKDARDRAALAEAAVAWLPDADALAAVKLALADPDVNVAATAADALGARLEEDGFAPGDLLDRVAARLSATADPEPTLSLLGALCATPQPRFEEAVRTAHAHPSQVVREAARACLKTLDGSDPGPGTPSAATPVPPVDPTALLGQDVTWQVDTTRGTFIVVLDADLAPYNVAVLTSLAQKGFYDGTLWHRVVPDFVVQGGDPTGSGWGGPGYTVPAEPSQTPYDRGAVGIADAGRDTGGSQWFVMHSAAPHLEQRYTLIGHVTSGMDVVDLLQVGDKILHVRVTITPRQRASR
jgi:cyclophilin family peptidyl-prolyl cis-trans isomerase